jgi:DNA-binding response OmpR family regulator
MRVLIVEDEHKIANAVKRGLEQEGFAADAVYDAEEGFGMLAIHEYDVIILDRMLPGNLDGIALLKAIRAKSIHTPVIFLTAKDQLQDRVEGLDAGADDYLVKPFAFEELLARVRALLRRPKSALETVLNYQDLTLDPVRFEVRRDNKAITLTAKEFALLDYLMRNTGRILTKDNIISHVWNYDADILPNTVEVYMGYLRKKIDSPTFGSIKLIHTRHGFGYIFGDKERK